MKRPQRILVVNDDGIYAPGLDVCEAIARAVTDDVWVVAPETDQSGVAHSVSLNDPLRLRQLGERRFAVKGTPTDCAIMGVRHILEGGPPDLILSGVNRGHNAAEDVTYSGTIAGAIEGTLLGVPSIALSQSFARGTAPDTVFACAEAHGPDVVFRVIDAGIARGRLVNVNFPPCPPERVEGMLVTRQGRRNQDYVRVEGRRDGRNNPYYWIVYGHQVSEAEEGTDLWALSQRMISVTPLRIDMTDDSELAALAEAIKAPV